MYAAPLTRWPNWVYEQYDARCLVERVHGVLGTLRLFSQTQVRDLGIGSLFLIFLSKYHIQCQRKLSYEAKNKLTKYVIDKVLVNFTQGWGRYFQNVSKIYT